jgi:hypothetical protein
MRDELSKEALAMKTADALIHLPEKDQIVVMKEWYEGCDEEKKKRLHDCSFMYAYPSKRKKIEIWMESTFIKNMKLTPKQVAHICVNCFRIKKCMLPYFISLAQKVKKRIICREIMRRKKQGGSIDEAG